MKRCARTTRTNTAKGAATDTLKGILREQGPDIVFAMAQKYLERTGETDTLTYEVPVKPDERAGVDQPSTRTLKQTIREKEFETLNESDKILILVDEAHRSHTQSFHANMMKAMPNAAKIGFTGTPIMKCDARGTRDIFGDFIDKYRMQESEDDGATVPILYEGRTADGLVEHADRLDEAFEDMFTDYTPAEQQTIRQKYATQGDVLEAPKLIAAKARDMIQHYVGKVLPNGFKARRSWR